LENKVAGSYQDQNEDGKVAWYPDPKMPNEKPPKGQDPDSVQSVEADTPKGAVDPNNAPIFFGSDGVPYSSVSTVGETTAEFVEAFEVTFGVKTPKNLISQFTAELQGLQRSRTNKPIVGKSGTAVVYKGVSPQERQNILDKYLKSYATNVIGLATAGDAKALASLNKGKFGTTLTTLRNAYANNGLPINEKSLLNAALESSLNPKKLEQNINLVNLSAKTYFPALSAGIDSGYTVKQLLTPYLNSRANILEEDADSIDIKSLQGVAKDPKGLMNLYEYEISLRKDPKWRYTKNAQDSLSSIARDMTKMFGLGA
jgi:hypothetical protein